MSLDKSAKKILIVEDCCDLQTLLVKALKDYSAQAVDNGAAALALLEKGLQPDLVLFDMCMPEMDGAEFLSKLRQKSGAGTIKAVVVSGIDELSKKAQEMGADGFIRKPIDLATLYKEVAKHTH